MKLTGRLKEDFLEYLQSLPVAPYEVMLDHIPECYLNALIIEFLDLMDIRIWVSYNDYIKMMFDSYVDDEWLDFSLSRIEAINKAILKANEEYNNLGELDK